MIAAAVRLASPASSDTRSGDACRTSMATTGSAPAPIPLPAELTAYPMRRPRRSGSRTGRRYHRLPDPRTVLPAGTPGEAGAGASSKPRSWLSELRAVSLAARTAITVSTEATVM